ncbi:serine O-acetyltransferase [Litoreibacter halocynthiae]|uniref:serine O-acetyltransferase n=1 Tax=Litoreibacter halocynthiae TaxID=1242689 RepID=UPI002492CA05|nr:serine O-acetyltransferase [Litoreibacter halocynthiae]
MKLVDDVRAVLEASPEAAAILGLGPFEGFHDLAGGLLSSLCKTPALNQAVTKAYRDKALAEMAAYDIAETARRNFEPGGAASALLFSRGVQAIMGHRVAHKYWVEGDTTMALALKAAFGRAFSTDIHPAAQIGAGLWLDHGLGCVVGETSIIEEDVSIWHNVTLGSTLTNSGPRRHPHIGTGAVIGAGAILLGNIKIGAHANIAAGAVVVQDVAQNALVVGAKATVRGDAKVSFVEREGTRK